jgi:hypothetical protein
MHRDEVTTPRRGSDHGTSSATRSGGFGVPDSRNTADGPLSFSPDEWQAFITKVQAMAPYLLSARATAPTRR